MRSRTPLLAVVAVAAVLAGTLGKGRADSPVASRPTTTADEPPAADLPYLAPRVDSDPNSSSACSAPSVISLHAYDDTRDPSVATCAPGDAWGKIADREEGATQHCELAGRRVSFERIVSGAVPLGTTTSENVRRIFRVGQSLGRRADAFGLVGDSMTVEHGFLRPFASEHVVVPAVVEHAFDLTTPRGTTNNVVDFFRNATATTPTMIADPFLAPRAAKVGVRAPWALTPRGQDQATPVDEMVQAESPAYAVILYGANDALGRTDSLPRLEHDFTLSLTAIVDRLEALGVVPILTTIPKHMRERGWPDCPTATSRGSNELFAAQASALSADVADLACRRHVPLIDLRWSLDPLLDHGIGPDGVHLSEHPSGGGVLDPAGLQCGYNVRNVVTLRTLAMVVDATAPGVW